MHKPPNIVSADPQLLQPISRQMNMKFDSVELQGMSPVQRSNVIRHLASLLAQAAGVALAKGHDDE
jgi:hypothetical protein